MADDSETTEQFKGHDLFDLDGNKIGMVEDARHDALTGALQWLVVSTGVPGANKIFVPAGDVRRSADRLSVLHTKQRVEDGPKVEDEHALTEAEKGKLCRYYGLQYVAPAQEAAEGCVEMPDVRPAG